MENAVIKYGLKAPDPKDLTMLAEAEAEPPAYRPLWEYGETIHVLYTKKGYTWQKIADWFAEQGMNYSLSHFSIAYTKWKAMQAMD